jgi:hypothetical protein
MLNTHPAAVDVKSSDTAPISGPLAIVEFATDPRTTEPTREDWLRRATDLLRPAFLQRGAQLPAHLHLSVGFPSVGALRRKAPRVGECWSPQASRDGAAHLFLSPLLSEPVEVLAVLVHELVHAAVGTAAGHGPVFRRLALALGLRGKMKATVAGPELGAQLEQLHRELGAFPHAGLLDLGLRTKQSTRLLKIDCPECGYTARTTAKWLAIGFPTCPCGQRMRLNS